MIEKDERKMTTSAGLAVYRNNGDVEVLLGHMGGPYWAKKDEGAWSFPKGERLPGEPADVAARREFAEELGFAAPLGPLRPLGLVRASAKEIEIFGLQGEVDLAAFAPGSFSTEWPPRSGRLVSFPEIDRAAWFALDDARRKLSKAQRPFVDRLAQLIK